MPARFWRSSRRLPEAAQGFPAFCGRCRAARARSRAPPVPLPPATAAHAFFRLTKSARSSVRQRPGVLGAHDAADGRRAVVAPSAPSVIRGLLAEVAQNEIAPAGVLVSAEIPHVEGEPLLPGTLRVVLAFAARFRHEQGGLAGLARPIA